MNQELYDRIKGIIVDILAVEEDKITPAASFREDLGADSLDLVQILVAVEDTFGIEIPDEDTEKFQSLGDFVDYIKSRTAEKEGS